MPKGQSGRIVIEIDPHLKAELYESLEKEGIHLKTWFVENVNKYLSTRSQLKLSLVEESKHIQKGF